METCCFAFMDNIQMIQYTISGQINRAAFLHEFVTELKHLHPSNIGAKRTCTVTLRCMICDGAERFKLKGTIGTSGYWACDKCICP